MRRKILGLMLMCAIMLNSCGYNGYSGNNLDLYSVAINSVLWLNGYSWGADFQCDPQIEIIDKDNYGRVMFTYYEKHYKGSDMSFSALIICQGSNNNEVLYYEDINYIVKEQELYSQNIESFGEDQIESLKIINDWNKEINYNKCVRKSKLKNKPKIPNEEEIKKQIVDEFELVDGAYSLYMDFLTTNFDKSKYILYGYISKNEKEGIYFIGLVENEDAAKIDIIIPSNEYDCKTEFIKFKELNYWY